MDPARSLGKVKGYLVTQMRETEAREGGEAAPSFFVTISRQSGAGGRLVAEHLVEILDQRGFGSPRTPWVVLDKNLIEQVIAENDLPESYMDHIEEKVRPGLQTVVNELLSVHPAISRLVAMTSRTILHLATMGNAVLVGRAATVVASGLSGGLHVRLVGSPGRRLQLLMDYYELSREQASRRMAEEDEGRRFYLKKHFSKDVDDPLLYDLVLNTDTVEHQAAARTIAAALEIKPSR